MTLRSALIPNAVSFDRSPSLRGALAPKQPRSRKRGRCFWIAAAANGCLAMTPVAGFETAVEGGALGAALKTE